MTTLGDLTGKYILERTKLGAFTATTAKNTRYVLWHFVDFVGADTSPDKLTPRKVEKWMMSRTLAPGSLRNEMSKVRCFCRWMVMCNYARRDPTVRLASPKEPRRLPRSLPTPQTDRVVQHAAADPRLYLVTLLMLQEGLRCVEVSRLQAGDVDHGRRTIRIVGKGGHQRELPLSEQTWSALATYTANHPSTGPLIRSLTALHKGIKPNTVSLMVGHLMHEVEAGGSAHALRHTMARDLIDRGGDIRAVRDALGHTNISTTDRYIGATDPKVLRSVMAGRTYGSDAHSGE